MNNTALYSVLSALLLGILSIMLRADDPPETGFTQIPKQCIQAVEENKAAKRPRDAEKQARGE